MTMLQMLDRRLRCFVSSFGCEMGTSSNSDKSSTRRFPEARFALVGWSPRNDIQLHPTDC